MPIHGTRSQQGSGAATAAKVALPKETGAYAIGAETEEPSSRKLAGYGLPCSKCHLYYPADLEECPTCHHKERVSPAVPKFPARSEQVAAEPVPDSDAVEQEREEFLRQFKSRLLEAHAEVMNAPESTCKFTEHHPGEPGKADVCTGCYERLQERLDVCEAALHIDMKEAAQIVYDAVWADPSDPGKTYQNAASALLTELRKRAGITSILGPFQPLTH
ncbi:MAG TPA: hypothetical protein VMG82_17870 [Candidatus Sulfotelmatobacter sp.]|nr:hypothetical protein [Candidatus Sulfotelmatobacter sp.]